MVAERLPVQQRTPEWLEVRKDSITATDAAVIAGEKGSVLELWALKRGLVEPEPIDDETQELFDEGIAIEPYLLDYWKRKTGRRARAVHTMRRLREWPIAVSSPDGEEVGQPRGIELKMSRSPRWPEALATGDPVPGDVLAQVQWQMLTAGWQEVDVVAFLWGRPRLITVPRDQAYIDDLIWLARRFWDWKERGIQPPVDGTENARRVLAQIYARNNGQMLMPAADLDLLAEELRLARAEAKAAEARQATIENGIRAVIGDADGFEGPWGRITWRKNADSEKTDWKLVAGAYRRVIEEIAIADPEQPVPESLDAIESTYTRTIEGPRVLRPYLKEEKIQ